MKGLENLSLDRFFDEESRRVNDEVEDCLFYSAETFLSPAFLDTDAESMKAINSIGRKTKGQNYV